MVSWVLSSLLLVAVAGQGDCTVVYFGSADCQPCQQIAPALSQLKQEGWDIRAVDVTQSPSLAQQYRIANLPTIIILQNQREIDRVVGAVAYEQLLSRFTRAAARGQSSAGSQLPTVQLLTTQPATTQPATTQPATTQPATTQPATTKTRTEPLVRGQSSAAGFPMLAASAVTPLVTAAATNLPTNRAAAPSQALAAQSLAAQALAAQSLAAMSPAAMSPTPDMGHSPQRQSGGPPTRQPSNAPSAKPALTVDQAIARAAAATVRIKVEEANTTAYGTGTVIDVHGSEALILTCGHLFRDMKPGSQLSVDLFAGTPREVNVFAQLIDFKAEDEDIGLISFRLPVAIEPVEILPRSEQLQVGQPAFSFGCDHGDDPTRRDTQVRHINRYVGAANVEILGAPAVGRSGGGLFDLQGRLIGVCNAADSQDDEGIYAAAEVVYTQIERLGMAQLFDKQPADAPVQFANGTRETPGSLASLQNPINPASFEQPAVLALAEAANLPTAMNPNLMQVGKTDTQEIICIVRDATGQNQVMTISGPSPELLRAIQQNAQ